MPLVIPVSSSNTQSGGGGGNSSGGSGGDLGPLSRIYAEYENTKKKPTATALKKRSRSVGNTLHHHPFVLTASGEKKRRSLALQDHPIWNNNMNINMASVVTVDEKPPKQYCSSGSSTNEEKMALPKKEGVTTPTPCNYYVNGCTENSIKDGLCKTHWCAVNLCTIDGCSKLVWRKGYCRGHDVFSTNLDQHATTLGMGKATVGGEEEEYDDDDGEMSMEGTIPQVKEEAAPPIEGNEPHKKKKQKQNASGTTKQTSTQRKPCTAEGCSNQSVVNGVCFRHGAKRKLCDMDGCTNHSIRGGVCFRHGAKRKLCKIDECTNLTQRKGVCVKHGAFVADAKKKTGNLKVDQDEEEVTTGQTVLCVEIPPDLSSKSSSELLQSEVTCEKEETQHDVAAVQRSVSASSTEALSIDAAASSEIIVRCRSSSSSDESCPPPVTTKPVTKGGCTTKTTKAGRKVRSCKTEGCTNRAIQGGQCFRHGAKAHRKVCSSEGCKNYVVKAGVCIKHGARQASKKNVEEEPTKSLKQECDNTSASEDDTEKRGRKVRSCKTEGCTNRAIQGGQCFRHGAKAHRKVCSSEGCKNYVVKAGVCIKHGARQASKKNVEEEPKHEESLVEDDKSIVDCATQITSLKQEYETSAASKDDLQKRGQDELFDCIDRLEDSCANILLLLKNDC